MAIERAFWQGEPIVMIVASSRAAAEDAAEAVIVEYEELPVTADKESALNAESPVIHPELGDNLAFQKTINTGDVEKALAESDIVIEETFEFGRHTAVSLETRALLADYNPADEHLTIYSSSQVPHMIQAVFARTLGVAEHKVRIIACLLYTSPSPRD